MARPSKKFANAFAFANRSHAGQKRKGTSIPYISHPMAVASLVLEFGGSEDQAAAALLHDTIEDCGVSRARLRERFGAPVAGMVQDCTDADTFPKPPWKQRKLRYIAHLRGGASARSVLVSAADKLHNARAIVRDVRHGGRSVWKRFNAAPAEIVWYYRSLLKVFRDRSSELSPSFRVLVRELAATVGEMEKLAR